MPVQPLWQKYSDFQKLRLSLYAFPSRPTKGRFAIVTNVGAGCDGRGQFCETSSTGADGEVVWSRRLDAGVKSVGIPAEDGDNQARSPGRARSKPLKPLRAGMPGCPGGLVVTTLVCFFTLHARLRVHCAPGIPHALSWAEVLSKTRTHRAAR